MHTHASAQYGVHEMRPFSKTISVYELHHRFLIVGISLFGTGGFEINLVKDHAALKLFCDGTMQRQ